MELTEYQQVIYTSRYARWDENEGRREVPEESIDRYANFLETHLKNKLDYDMSASLKQEIVEALLNQENLPSMRAFMTSGPALERDNVAGYNCAYLPIDSPRSFDEMMYILMCGTGVGFSVENKYVSQLPKITEQFEESDTTIVVADSKLGWAKAFRELISLLIAGQIPKWDLSKLRPAGARLKTFGGRSSGPGPLDNLFRFTVELFQNAAGRRLTSLEAHDLCCKIGEIVVVGGVRRSALISLSDLDDYEMATAKSGNWWEQHPERALANNSAVYESKPGVSQFLHEWKNLYDSHSGERGIYNRQAATKQAAKNGRRDTNHEFGVNPCAEIILRPFQFCNLTSIVVRAEDDLETLKRKARMATILGTVQSTMSDFRYLRKIWQKNTEEERLLGVSMTGQMSHPVLNQVHSKERDMWLQELQEVVVETNKEFAAELGIEQSTATTCVKPEGSGSQYVGTSSGMSPWYSKYFIRRVRQDIKDPLTQFLMTQLPYEQDVMNDQNVIFSFPMAAPKTAKVVDDFSAVDHLDIWLAYKQNWAEHTISVTVNVKEEEWLRVANWVYDNFDEISGISFLPHSDHIYKQAPLEAITEERYLQMKSEMPTIYWDDLKYFEKEDTTTSSQELACVAGACEV